MTAPVLPDIRALRHDDVEAITKIAHASFPEKWRQDEFLFFIEHPATYSFALWENDHLIAYFIGLLVQGDLDVITLATDENYRRQGKAKALLEAIFRAPEIEQVFLEVAADNTGAILLYQNIGFEITGVRPRYYQGKTDAVLMKLTPSA